MLNTYQAAMLNNLLQSKGYKFDLFETVKRNQTSHTTRTLKRKKVCSTYHSVYQADSLSGGEATPTIKETLPLPRKAITMKRSSVPEPKPIIQAP